ncbi:MAG: hypothetical protein AVDCRST_MAG59-4889 [uncultured Thermomicrobiales bacterium]|uniref:Uncharacterized protein n=1 Tax=uncultured Thermomicrobiales bacterium TaxID=1645740 RepID=A0A6J4VT06_9BACT|nr:MAG: hypothetical protein AVDCRST_MAG59-4889 [uncultured Thermomicrobiales bacterium]
MIVVAPGTRMGGQPPPMGRPPMADTGERIRRAAAPDSGQFHRGDHAKRG